MAEAGSPFSSFLPTLSNSNEGDRFVQLKDRGRSSADGSRRFILSRRTLSGLIGLDVTSIQEESEVVEAAQGRQDLSWGETQRKVFPLFPGMAEVRERVDSSCLG
jgi:hypothetical protein